MTTVTPDKPLSKPIWMKEIARKEIDLGQVQPDNLLGQSIIEGYRKNPEETLKMLTAYAHDNPELLKKVIGVKNFQLII